MAALECVIFDLDNTLVDSELDFAQIRREIGADMPILEYRAEADETEQMRVDQILDRHEARAAAACTLCPGARELLDFLAAEQVPTALLTRNSRKTVARVTDRHDMRFDVTVSREDCEPKPSSAAVLLICEKLAISTANTIVVGDYIYDMLSAERAGAMTMLVNSPHRDRFEYEADYEVDTLHEARVILKGLLSGKEQ